jgi:Tfp pilus assembly protein PilX
MWWIVAAQAALSAGQAYSSAQSGNVSLDYQAKIARLNAKLANSQAEAALREGERQQAKILTETSRLKASQKAAYGASGVDVNASRSVTNVLTSTEVAGEIDRLHANANAVTKAWDYRMQATRYENDALLAKASKQDAGMAAFGAGLAAGLQTYAATSGGKGGTTAGEQTATPSSAPGESFMSNARQTVLGTGSSGIWMSNPWGSGSSGWNNVWKVNP